MAGFVPRRPGEAPGAFVGYRTSARFGVPEAPEADTPGYSEEAYPELRVGPESIPDDIRVGKRNPPPNAFVDVWPRNGEIDRQQRQADERRRPAWHTHQEGPHSPVPSVPEWNRQIPGSRPTADLAPMSYYFTREWHIPRNVEDVYGPDAEERPGQLKRHFSLADHRRNYAILIQRPQGRTGVNTYRKDPTPWDASLYNSPVPPIPQERTAFNSISGNRSFRYGG